MNRDTRRTRVLLALLLITSISLITIDYRGGDSSPLDGVRSAAAAVFGPVEKVAAAIASPVSDAVDSVSNLGDGRDEAARLKKQNQELKRRLRTGALDRHRAQELDDLLHLAGAGRYKIVPARVIAIGTAQTFSWTVTLDAGSRDGTAAGHDGAQRRRPGRPGQDGRPVDGHRAARGRPGVVGGGAARGPRWRSASPPASGAHARPRPRAARRPVDGRARATGW